MLRSGRCSGFCMIVVFRIIELLLADALHVTIDLLVTAIDATRVLGSPLAASYCARA